MSVARVCAHLQCHGLTTLNQAIFQGRGAEVVASRKLLKTDNPFGQSDQQSGCEATPVRLIA